MAIPALMLKVISQENGMITVEKMCWGCGELHELTIPLDDYGTERMTATMCNDCVVRFCTENS